jgi:hypothetical protein
VAFEQFLGAYSGGAVPDFHRLPKNNACVQLKHLQLSRRLPVVNVLETLSVVMHTERPV